MKTKTLYGCAIQRVDKTYTIIGPLETDPEKIRKSCEMLEPDGAGRKIYNVAKIEIEIE